MSEGAAEESMTTVLAYGSLCSGLGLQNLGRLSAGKIERVRLSNCRRGFGKLAQSGDRYAMVLEAMRPDEPIRIDNATTATSGDTVCALALDVRAEDLSRISRREGYDPSVLRKLQSTAKDAGLSLARYLWHISRSVGFEPVQYRRSLFERTGYTSPHYIPHPLARGSDEPALIFLPPGPEGSGDDSIVPVRVAMNMIDVLSIPATWKLKGNRSQIEYFAMCLLAEIHGISFADVVHDLDPRSDLAALLKARLRAEMASEEARFCAVLGLSKERYRLFRNGHAPTSWLFEPSAGRRP